MIFSFSSKVIAAISAGIEPGEPHDPQGHHCSLTFEVKRHPAGMPLRQLN
jgi:hypothetical protein